ncbi:BQ5605_C023g09615 [Microbotryum silenes-dioicae]|uniref:BQ5605_C023g09615 protein n=1 Tax=Microbotryum silenes-dioicae TaxID=796604 RepID=A0A2X0N790_9BASI|nr:BQ5605_C023g09615 [Microbotryum silenes-dioicae]
MAAYRGAVVEDLQLSPALVLSSDTTVDVALQMAFEREFSIIPISHPSTRRLQGWLSSQALQTQVASGLISGQSNLSSILERPNSNSEETTPTSSGTTSSSTKNAVASAVTRFRKEGDYQGPFLPLCPPLWTRADLLSLSYLVPSVITPNTPLEELEAFFTQGQTRNVTFALVTDQVRKKKALNLPLFSLSFPSCSNWMIPRFISRREPNYKPTFTTSNNGSSSSTN